MSDDLVVRADQAPELLDAAERALELVTRADDAEVMWRKLTALKEVMRMAKASEELRLRGGRLQLRAERRWGELLGPAEVGRPEGNVERDNISQHDRNARHVAREVANVPEVVFERYLTTTRDPEKLRRAHVLELARKKRAEQRRAQPIEPTTITGGIEIRHGNFRTALADLAGRVDAIITDPPYAGEFVDSLGALGASAVELLADDGVLVVMVGQAHLPLYLDRLGRHLEYRWCGAYLTPGPTTAIHGRRVGTNWKPLLIFGGTDYLAGDVFASAGADKNLEGQLDGWGQSESGMADIVSRTTKPGALVVDPYLGAGTTAIVCRDLDRRFVGCDDDADAIAAARERLA